MSLVMPRLLCAVAGFISEYGKWPTMIAVPAENWTRSRSEPATTSSYENDELVHEVLARVELVPLPRQLYVALDDEGRYYDYGSNESEVWDWKRVISASLRAGSTRPRCLACRPLANSYVVPRTLLAAGEYPGSPPSTAEPAAREKLQGFIDAGIRAFIDLTGPDDHLTPYEPMLRKLAAARGVEVHHERFVIRDNDVCDATLMNRVLNAIDAHLAEGRGVYVHCWGGIGRTGLVVGCWLVRHGRTGDRALAEVNDLFRSMAPEKVRRHISWGSPQTESQRAMVHGWLVCDNAHTTRQSAPYPVGSTPSIRMRDRYRGAMLGLAAGDALGTTLEFTTPGGFQPISDMVGGGPFKLKPGQWTDDTSMALCLAESLLERGGFDAVDQMQHYVRWVSEGYWSSTGFFFDVGGVVRTALSAFQRTGDGFSGPTDEHTAGNGSLMRLAPIALFFASDAELAIRMAADSSRTTHGTAAAIDACRYFAGLLVGALRGTPKAELLADCYTPVPELWERKPLHPAVATVASGSFLRKAPPAIRGGKGYVVDTLEAALWAFATTDTFEAGALAAVNLGGDADTTGAVFGQIAGAYYGADAIPARWRERLAFGAEIGAMADRLYDIARGRSADGGGSV